MRVLFLAFALVALTFGHASAQQVLGKVNGGGGPIAKSTVTLLAATEGAPTKLSETSTGDDGAFHLQFDNEKGWRQRALPDRQGWTAHDWRLPRSEPGYRADGNIGRLGTEGSDHQRTHYRGIGMDRSAIPQR